LRTFPPRTAVRAEGAGIDLEDDDFHRFGQSLATRCFAYHVAAP
jgi:hypothetical protein